MKRKPQNVIMTSLCILSAAVAAAAAAEMCCQVTASPGGACVTADVRYQVASGAHNHANARP